VDFPSELTSAAQIALEASHSHRFIIEDFLEKEGLSSGSESFFVDGELKYNAFYDQYFDNEAANPYTPSAEIWPTEKAQSVQDEIKEELQRLGTLLEFRTGLFNIEWRVCKNGKAYLMEVSPRAGGNRLAEILNYATDVDIIEAEVLKALGESIPDIHEPCYNGAYAIWVLHSKESGRFRGLKIDSSILANIVEQEVRIEEGQSVSSFKGANDAIGTLFIKERNREMLDILLGNLNDKVGVVVCK
jgi:biotin carboxylase